jgi:hypothetical protein
MLLFFSVARSQESGSWERATETAHNSNGSAVTKPVPKVAAPKTGANPNFGVNMPMMSSAFDTAAWLNAA